MSKASVTAGEIGEKSTRLYPIALKLDEKLCLVIGGGEIAGRKVESLIGTGATVKVVGRHISAEIKNLAETGKIELAERDFAPSDLEGVFLAVAATDDSAVNSLASAEAAKRGVLINVVDQPELCDFYLPAVVERGRLQATVSTGGVSPALAGHLRKRLEAEFGPEYGDYLEIVGLFRRRLRDKIDKSGQGRAYERLFASDLLDRVRQGANVDVDDLVEEYASGS